MPLDGPTAIDPQQFMTETTEAVVNTAGASADGITNDAAPDHTPDAVIAETDAVTEEQTEATPSADENDESVEAQTTDTIDGEASPDDATDVEPDFSDLTPNFIPADEVIDKLRIPKDERERLKKVAELARSSSAVIEELGGNEIVDTLKPLGKVLTKSGVSTEESAQTIEALMTANPVVTTKMLYDTSVQMMQLESFATPILTAAFGENATFENVRTLLALDKEGLVDKEYDIDPTETSELKSKIAELEKKLQAKDAEANPPSKAAEQAVKELENDFYAEIPKKVAPLFERLGWDADSPMAQILIENLQFKLKADPKYLDTEQFLKQVGVYRNGEQRQAVVNANLHLLANQAVGQAQKQAVALQQWIKANAEKTRNKIVQQKQQAAAANAAPKAVTPKDMPDRPLTLEEKQAQAREKLKAALNAEPAR